jgi:hypothetical protein
MVRLFRDKLFIVLVMLLAITLFSWLMLYYMKLEPKAIGALLLLLAFVKVQLIISQYMELNKAVLLIRVAFWMWTMGVAAMSIGMYLRGF